jgi:hypothetical protein
MSRGDGGSYAVFAMAPDVDDLDLDDDNDGDKDPFGPTVKFRKLGTDRIVQKKYGRTQRMFGWRNYINLHVEELWLLHQLSASNGCHRFQALHI